MNYRVLSWLRRNKAPEPIAEPTADWHTHHIVTLRGHERFQEKPGGIPLFGNKPAWVHLYPRSEQELISLLHRYHIHPLTVEDIFNTSNRIKREKFPHYTYYCFRGVHLAKSYITTMDFNFIVTRKTLITVTESQRLTIDRLLADEALCRELLRKGPEFILHRILDIETDHTLRIVHEIDLAFERCESALLSYREDVDIAMVFELKSSLATIKKLILTHKEIFDEMQQYDIAHFSPESAAFFRDVRDHAIKIIDTIDGITQAIASAIEAYHTISTKRTNDIIRILTIMTAIMLPLTLITGYFGMNFEHLPLTKDYYGYLKTIIGMAVLAGAMLLWFIKKKWL
ncbi:MAG: magnesium transporter CorA family protein [Leptospiraceae bacterium]|nr:magnesium transporter CorA family protein [Leptospiraceae bacterium]